MLRRKQLAAVAVGLAIRDGKSSAHWIVFWFAGPPNLFALLLRLA